MACNASPESDSNELDSTTFTINSGDGQFSSINSTFTFPLQVQIAGVDNLENIPVFYEILPGSVPATLSSSVANTNASGVAGITVNAGGLSGIVSVRATAPLATSSKSVVFNLNVNGNVSDWYIEPTISTTVTAGTAFTLDIEGRLLTNLPDPDFDGLKFLAFSTTAVASPDGTNPILPPDGIYNFTDGVIDTPPSVTLYDSSENGADTFTISISGSSLTAGTTSPITVNDAAINEIRILDGNACTAPETGATTLVVPTGTQFYAYYFDAYENCIEGTPANADWTKSLSDVNATFTGGPNGVQNIQYNPLIAGINGTVTVNDGTFSDTTGLITHNNGAATDFVILGLDSDTNFVTTAGSTVAVLVEARDVLNNVAQTYAGPHALTWTSTATAPSPPAALGLGVSSPSLPTNTTYNFNLGVLISPVPNLTLFNSGETPTITVDDGSINGTSSNITVNDTTVAHALVRSLANNVGGDPATFNAPALSPTADDSYALHCATYDTYGNYVQDDPNADWGVTGAILAGNITPDLVDESTVTYTATDTGIGSVFCDVDGTVDNAGIADDTGNFNIAPGAPDYFTVDGGAGDGNPFAVTAGVNFPITIRAYDSDGNFASNYTNASFPSTVSILGSTAVNTPIPSEITPTFTQTRINNVAGTSQTVNLNFASGLATVSNNLLINDTEDSDEVTINVQDNGAVVSAGTSGAITVNQGAVAFISIRDAASNGGNVVNAPSTDNDSPLTFYSAGYDAAGNYVADTAVDWTNTGVSGDCVIGDIAGNPGPTTATNSIIYDPSQTGNCTITATHGGSGDSDDTGAIASSNGAAASLEVTLVTTPPLTTGVGFTIRVTALDADGNRVLDYTPDTTYSLTTTAGAAPEGAAPAGFSLVPGDFVSGQATISGLQVFDATTATSFTITATETGGGSLTGTSASINIGPNTLHHYETASAVGPFVADGASTFSVEVRALDEWGNLTTTGIGANIDLTPVQVSDETNVGTIGSGSGLSLGGSSSATFGGLTYAVSHEIDIVATDTGTITTPVANRERVTFTPDIAGVVSYEIDNFSTLTPTAGVPFTVNYYAKDVAGNTVTGVDGDLGALTFTMTSSATNSDYGSTPSHPSGTLVFTNGESANATVTFFNDESIDGTDIDIDDGTGRVGDAGTNNITVGVAALNHYANSTSTPFPITADGTSTFQAVITARDVYGNVRAGDASIDLGVNHITAQSAGTLGGSTTSINMTSGTTTINDLTYDVFGTMELTVGGGASVTMDAARSVDYNFIADINSLSYYELAFAAGATAGTPHAITVTAKDGGGNTLIGLDGTLNGRTFSWGGINNSPEGDTPTAPTSLTFAGGIATPNVTFVNAEVIGVGSLTLTDSGAISGSSTGALTISPDAPDHIVFLGATTGVADNTTNYSLTVEARDQFGNATATGAGADASLTLAPERVAGANNVGSLGGSITGINLRDNPSVTIADITYQVPHSMRFDFTSGPSIAIDDSLSTTVVWSAVAGTVADYTIEPLSASVTAGATTTFALTALDGGGNVIVGEDATLNGFTFNFTTSADCDAPNLTQTAAANDPADGTKTFTNGVTTLTYSFYESDGTCGNAGDISVTDVTNGLPADSNTTGITINPAPGNYFTTTTTGVGFPATADGSPQTTTDLTITLYDQYGNLTTGAFIGNLLSIAKVSGFGASTGTLTACATDTCGAGVNVTTIPLDFRSSSTETIYDLSYTVGQTIEVIATSGAVTTSSANAADLVFNESVATIASYTITPDSGTGTAGAPTDWTLAAFDAAGNPLIGAAYETLLEGLTHTITDQSGGNMNGADSGVVAFPSTSLDWNPGTGTASLTGANALTFFNTTNNVQPGYIQVEDNQATPISATNSSGMFINPAAANKFKVAISGFHSGAELADGQTYAASGATVSLYDVYGNLVPSGGPAVVNFEPRYVSGEGTTPGTLTVGGLDITTITRDFSATASHTLSGFGYDVGHVMEIRAYDGGGIDTAAGESLDYSWTASSGTVASYTIEPDAGSAVAGAATDWTITAFDGAGNALTGAANESVLESLQFTITDQSGGNMNGADSGTVSFPTNVTLDFNPLNGQASLTAGNALTFFNTTNGVQAGYIQVSDNQGTPVTATNTGTMTITPAAADHFDITAAGFTGTDLADDTAKTATSMTINLSDVYGNAVPTGGPGAASVVPIYRSGVGSSVGTLRASTSDGGGLVDVTTLSLDFSATSSITLYDFAYDIAHTIDLSVSQGGVTTTDADDVSFTAAANSIASYTITPDSASATAGANTTWTIAAFDSQGSAATGTDYESVLEGLQYSITDQSGGNMNGPETGTVSFPTNVTLDWNPGTGTAQFNAGNSLVFFNSANNVVAGDIQVSDDQGIPVTALNTVGMTINAATADHFETIPNGNFDGSEIADGTEYEDHDVVIEQHDVYGNLTTGSNAVQLEPRYVAGASPAVGTVTASLTDGGANSNITSLTVDMTSLETATLYDLSYTVDHSMEIRAFQGARDTSPADAGDISWDPGAGTIASYTFEPVAGSGVAGTATTWRVTAFDGSGNALVGASNEAILEALQFTVTDQTAGDMNGPDSGTIAFPTNATLDFDPGTGAADVSLTFFNKANGVAVGALQITDDQGSPITALNTSGMTIAGAAGDHFRSTTAGFTGNEDGDGTNYPTTSVTVTLYDQYGNTTFDTGAVTVAPRFIATPGNVGPNVGTLQAAVSAPAGQVAARADITTQTVSFATTESVTFSDFSYNIGQTIDLRTQIGAIDSAEADQADFTFDTTQSVVASYDITPVAGSATATAGAATDWTLVAQDAAGNTMLGTDNELILESLRYTITDVSGGQMDCPDGGCSVSFPSNIGLDFDPVTGEAQLTGVSALTFFNSTNNVQAGFIQIADDQGTPVTATNTGTMTIDADGPDRFETEETNLTGAVADGSDIAGGDLEIRLLDQYGNPATGLGAVSLSINFISGYGSTIGTFNSSTSTDITGLSLDFSAVSTINLTGLNYNVGHTIEVIATQGGVTTAAGDAEDIGWVSGPGTIASYTFSADSGTGTAGTATSWTVQAFDAAGNVFDEAAQETVLEGLQHSVVDISGATNMDGPESGNVSLPSGVTLDWNPANGQASLTGANALTFYNAANGVQANYLRFEDNQGTPVTVNNTDTMTINPEAGNHFEVVATVDGSEQADDVADISLDATIELHDVYGNATTDGTLTNVDVEPRRTAGYGATIGTLSSASGAITGDVTGTNLDFSGSSSQTLNDLSYKVGHTIEIRAFQGGVDTPTGESTDIYFEPVPATIGSYTFTPDSPTGTAGVATAWTLTAFDDFGNAMADTNCETMLEGLDFTVTDRSNATAGGDFDAPDGSETFSFTAPLNFDSADGTAPISLTFYHAVNDVAAGELRVSDDATAVTIDNSDPMNIQPNVADHFVTQQTGTFTPPETADTTAVTASEMTITLYDDYRNETTTATAVTLAPRFVSGYGSNLGTLRACLADTCGAGVDITTMSLDFSASSTDVLYDFNYNVGHTIEIVATAGAVTTIAADADDLEWINVTANVDSYTLTPDSPTGVAGTATAWTLAAFDSAGNAMTGVTNKGILDSYTFSITDLSAGGTEMDGPESGVFAFTPTALVWDDATGTAPVSLTFYNAANGVAAGYLRVSNDTTSVTFDNTATMTISGADGNHFHVTSGSFPIDADGNEDGASSITVQLQDVYGNPTMDTDVANGSVALSFLSGDYATTGTLIGCNDTDGCGGGRADVTGFALDFSTQTDVTLYDLSYDVAHTFELIVTEADAPAGTATGDSVDLTTNFVAGTVASYTFNFDATPVTAGVATTATLAAFDAAGNALDSNDATLGTINFTFDVLNANMDAPNASQTVAANDPTAGTLVWTSGTTSLGYTFYNSTNNVATGWLRVNDTTNTLSRTNQNTVTIDPAAADYFDIVDPNNAITGVGETITIESYDQFGNLDTNNGLDVTLATTGAATGAGLVDIVAGVGTIDIDNTVRETVTLSMTNTPATAITKTDTEDIIFTGPVDVLVYTTEPVANETINKTFGTGAVVELRDDTGNVVTADDTSTITLTAHSGAGCGGASGALANNTATATDGIATFNALEYNTADTISVEATMPAVTAACSSTFTVYPSLTIVNNIANLNTGAAHTYQVTGGVPPLIFDISTNNSGATLGGQFPGPGAGCLAGQVCNEYTAGATVGVTDTFRVRDSANAQNTVTDDVDVDGAFFVNIGAGVNWGNTAVDSSRTFTIENQGNASSGLSVSTFTPGDASYWSLDVDGCDVDLAPLGQCDMQVTFLGATGNGGNPVNGVQTATITVTGATTGDITLNLTANRDGAILSLDSGSVSFGTTPLNVDRSYVIRNTGNAVSGVISTSFTTGDASYWQLVADGCVGNTLGAGATCTIDYRFLGATGNGGNPANGAQSRQIDISASPGSDVSLNLTATRDGAIIDHTGGVVAYGMTGTDDPETFTFTNNGNATTGILTTTFTPDVGSYWTLGTDNCNGTSIAGGGGNCTITVTFNGASGGGASGPYSATLEVTGATGGTRTITLTGSEP